MGVKCVFKLKSSMASAQQVWQEFTSRVKLLKGRRTGRWRTTCTLLLRKAAPGQAALPAAMAGVEGPIALAKEMYVLQFSENVSLVYVVLAADNMRTVILEADRDMQPILDKLQVFQARLMSQMEGNVFELGDFVIKLGTMAMQSHVKGFICEIEYRGCAVGENDCKGIFAEVIEMLGLTPSYTELNEFVSKMVKPATLPLLPSMYSPQHTVFQYVTAFKHLACVDVPRGKATASSPAPGQENSPLTGQPVSTSSPLTPWAAK